MTEPLTKVRRIGVLHHGTEATARAVDTEAALAANDEVTAAIASTEALESACEAVLAAVGHPRSDDRPLVRRLSRDPVTAPWCDLVSRLLRPGAALAVERLRVAGLLLSWGTLEGWFGRLDELPAPPERVGGDGPRRSPFATPVRLLHGWALIGHGRDVEVSERALRVWRELDGRPLGEVLEALRRFDPRERPEDTAATVTWLLRQGLVEAPSRTASRALPR